MRTGIWMLAVMTTGFAWPAGAHDLTFNECVEGGDFILHAAQSRDYGLSRDEFLTRMQGDLLAIQSVPRELRWFVQDEEDEALLVAQAERVFDTPMEPQHHQSEFLDVCFERIGAQGAGRDAVRAADAQHD